MADPICRWRNPYIKTVKELIDILPKIELPKSTSREIVNRKSPGFYRTAYQLACQLGLYYETEDFYFPKFTFTPNNNQIQSYLRNWIVHYSAPNPYTKSLMGDAPFSIHSEICKQLYKNRKPLKWKQVRDIIFNQEIGNNDILINAINAHSPIIIIQDKEIRLKSEKEYKELISYTNIDLSIDRNNKEYFFDLFEIQENFDFKRNQIITDTNKKEKNIISELENSKELTKTEKNQIVKARIGQGIFRRKLIEQCNYCPFTLINDINILTASHIKPWAVSNNIERLDSYNGFIFTPTYDKLFDRGFISFTNEKKIILSPLLSHDAFQKLSIVENDVIQSLPITGREVYLEYHRNNIFQK